MPLRSYTPAEIMLTERRRLERPLLVLVWLGIMGFSIAEGSAFYLVAGSLAVLVNLMAVRRRQEIYVRRLFVNIGVLLATGVLAMEVFAGRAHQLILLSHYLILIQLCKLFEQKRARDYAQMLIMSLILFMAATLISDSPWLAAVGGIYLALACYTTMVFVLKRELDAAASARLVTEISPPSPQRVAWNVLRDWPSRRLRRVLVVSLVGILGMGVVVFLVTPREVGAGIGFFGSARTTARSGYSGNVHLGSPDRIYLSDRVVMRARLTLNGKPVTALGEAAYLRGQTFNLYRNSTWTRSGESFSGSTPEQWGLQAVPTPPPDALVQEVSMVPELLPVLFGSYPVVAMDVPGRTHGINPDLNYMTPRTPLSGGPVRYTAYSWTHPLRPTQRRTLAALSTQPAGDDSTTGTTQRVRDLGVEWCGELLRGRETDPENRDAWDLRIADEIIKQLQRRCTYTLDLSDADPARDGVEDFLFHMKRGHCEYFASGLTVMSQVLDVRARLATGFHLGDPSGEGTYIVRERDAHAWTEIFTPSTDWVVRDPSPPAHYHASGGWLGSVRRFWDSLNFAWYEKVAGYDAAARDKLLSQITGVTGSVLGTVMRGLRFTGQALWTGFTNLVMHGYVDTAMFVFAAAIGLLGLIVEVLLIVRAIRRRRHSPWSTKELKVPEWQLGFVVRLFSLLQKGGLKPNPAQTAMSAAREGAEKLHLNEEELVDLIELYYRLRWGGGSVDPERIQKANTKVARVETVLKR